MATTVKITETYDMKTTVGKMGLVGIHTPQVTQLRALYPGLLKNHRFFRFVKCDVVGACASVLPADPLQVGVESGKVAPEDMFNPILYKAVTNTSFDTIVARVRALSDVSALASVEEGDALPTFDEETNFKIYYALLSEKGKWRKSMPQNGFRITGLVPLAHTLVSTFGNVGPNMGNDNVLGEDGESPVPVPEMDIPDVTNIWATESDGSKSVYFRGRTVKMPKFPCHVGLEDETAIPYPAIPTTQVLALVLPPARLHEFWYRMRVTWTIRFENVCSTLEAGSGGAYGRIGAMSRGSNYVASSSKMDSSVDMVDADNVELTKVMES